MDNTQCAGLLMPLPFEYCNFEPCPTRDVDMFSCQDLEDLTTCDPRYNQGGLLTVTILEAKNLPDLDGWGAAAGETDAFARVTVTGSVRESGIIRGSLNPVWTAEDDNELFFDYKFTGTDIVIDVYDHDIGFEGGDDLVGSVTVKVPACSEFMREVCSEQTWLSLAGDNDHSKCNNTAAPCVKVRLSQTPLKVDVTFVHVLQQGIASRTIARAVPGGDVTWGRMYTGTSSQPIDVLEPGLRTIVGATVVKTRPADSVVADIPVYMRFTLNVPATVYVFREKRDTGGTSALWDATQPAWLKADGWSRGTAVLQLEGDLREWQPMQRVFDARAEVVIGGPRDGVSAASDFDAMFGILVYPVEGVDPPPVDDTLEFERTAFLLVTIQYALTCTHHVPHAVVDHGANPSPLTPLTQVLAATADHVLDGVVLPAPHPLPHGPDCALPAAQDAAAASERAVGHGGGDSACQGGTAEAEGGEAPRWRHGRRRRRSWRWRWGR